MEAGRDGAQVVIACGVSKLFTTATFTSAAALLPWYDSIAPHKP